MSNPLPKDMHVDSILSEISVAFQQQDETSILNAVSPAIPVDKKSDKYYEIPIADWFRDEAKPRADGDESAGGGWRLSTNSYQCEKYAIHKDITKDDLANEDDGLELRMSAVEWVASRIRLRETKQWFTDNFKAGVWANDYTGVASASPTTGQFTQWSDGSNSQPIEDIELGKEAIHSKTGLMPNTLLLGYKTFRVLKRHPDLVSQLQFHQNPRITADIMAGIFDVDRVMVSTLLENTAAEGQTASMSYLAGRGAYLCYTAPRPGRRVASAGYTFHWKGVSDGLGLTVGTKDFPIEERNIVHRIESEQAFDHKIVSTALGAFYATAVAA